MQRSYNVLLYYSDFKFLSPNTRVNMSDHVPKNECPLWGHSQIFPLSVSELKGDETA